MTGWTKNPTSPSLRRPSPLAIYAALLSFPGSKDYFAQQSKQDRRTALRRFGAFLEDVHHLLRETPPVNGGEGQERRGSATQLTLAKQMSYFRRMTQIISVSCKLEVYPELRKRIDATLQGFADGCNHILKVSKEEKQQNVTKLHHLTYHDVRAMTGLKANHACQAIRRVVGALKTRNKVRQFNPTSLSLDARTFNFWEEKEQVRITLIDGFVRLPLKIGNYQRGLLKGQKPTSATLVKRQNGDYYIQIQVKVQTFEKGEVPKVIGVDLGLRDIAHCSTGLKFDGSIFAAVQDKYNRIRASIQRKRTRSSRRLLKRLSGGERRFHKWTMHNISKTLVSHAKENNAAIAFEDLKGIRKRVKQCGKKQRRKMSSWPNYMLKTFTQYKGNIAGVPVFDVPAPYTSQTHHACLHIGKRKGKDFYCPKCNVHEDADFNAANVISLLGLSVSQPESPWLSCLIQGV